MREISTFSLLTLFFLGGMTGPNIYKSEIEIQKVKYNCLSQSDSLQIKILSNYSNINSVSELLDSFSDKPVFIDIWATWCEPCFEEFKYNEALYKFLTKNGIQIIYVSFDIESKEINWRNKVQENRLFGNHIRANKALRDNLTYLIWGGVDVYSLPNYLLFGKSKRLINKNSLHPSSGDSLFKEIEASLNRDK